jgi:hypothetical protein
VADLEIDRHILAGFVGGIHTIQTGIRIGNADGHIGNDGTGRISNRPNNRGLLSEC